VRETRFSRDKHLGMEGVFVMSIYNNILSDIVDISVFESESESEQKYKKCNISDIHPYPIRFHP
jgi:hypothetical protein